MFVLGAAEIVCPIFLPFLPLFLENMIDESELIERYMSATTESVIALLKAQLEFGVGGILGAED